MAKLLVAALSLAALVAMIAYNVGLQRSCTVPVAYQNGRTSP